MSAGPAPGSSLGEVEGSGEVVADGEAVPGSALGEGTLVGRRSVLIQALDAGELRLAPGALGRSRATSTASPICASGSPLGEAEGSGLTVPASPRFHLRQVHARVRRRGPLGGGKRLADFLSLLCQH